MKELRSFKDVIENRYYGEIDRAVSSYAENNLDALATRRVGDPEEADEYSGAVYPLSISREFPRIRTHLK